MRNIKGRQAKVSFALAVNLFFNVDILAASSLGNTHTTHTDGCQTSSLQQWFVMTQLRYPENWNPDPVFPLQGALNLRNKPTEINGSSLIRAIIKCGGLSHIDWRDFEWQPSQLHWEAGWVTTVPVVGGTAKDFERLVFTCHILSPSDFDPVERRGSHGEMVMRWFLRLTHLTSTSCVCCATVELMWRPLLIKLQLMQRQLAW